MSLELKHHVQEKKDLEEWKLAMRIQDFFLSLNSTDKTFARSKQQHKKTTKMIENVARRCC
ncbi:CLUMA_CG003323, isoform A [Clunio marinus]|uniref:CLUMA_CG003323, isoform A n=1 Tax=Clunio marinus TaxID=568069 RepID=A0A1J1HPV1_9DIPT|nr:CLUMA_CG003323, isoform A [Clunio marinus]